jgi:hypothetical protein
MPRVETGYVMRAHYSRSKTGRFLQELAHLTVNVSAREGAEFFTVRYTVIHSGIAHSAPASYAPILEKPIECVALAIPHRVSLSKMSGGDSV